MFNGRKPPANNPLAGMASQLTPLAALQASYYLELVKNGVPKDSATKLADGFIGQMIQAGLAQNQAQAAAVPPPSDTPDDDDA